MRKFTKEITALIASVTVGTCAAVNAAPATNSSADASDSCTECVSTTKTNYDYDRLEGTSAPSDYYRTRSSSKTEKCCDETTAILEEIPELQGYLAAPDEYPITDEYIMRTQGVAAWPDPTIEKEETTTTDEYIPRIEGDMAWPDTIVETEVTTTIDKLPPEEETDFYDTPTMGIMAPPDGDINTDYTVNASDLLELTNILLGKDNCVYYTDYADLNHDGKINIVDLVMLKNMLLE